jgi:glycosyltransferase involved in cell wall biosynthesis
MSTDQRISYYPLPDEDPQRVNRRGRNVNAGYMARNHGLEKAKGEFITFQDADDASFLNRIEVQYNLMQKYDAMHITLDWQQFKPNLVGKKFDVEKYVVKHKLEVVDPTQIRRIARRARGVAYSLLGDFCAKIDFEIKRARLVNKLFFGTLEGYPGTGNSPLFKREVIEKVKFRNIDNRVWPSFTGRGADRDFNFQVAETFGKSYTIFIPLYMWRVNRQNERYDDTIEQFLIQ